jgi:DNA-binding beta-propeller fold protein YncE
VAFVSGPRHYASQLREALRAAVAANGPAVLDDSTALGGLLADLLPDAPQVIQVLLAAVRTGMVTELTAHAAHGMDAMTAIRLTATTMRENTLVDEDTCLLVSTELAIALEYPGAPDSAPTGEQRGEPPAAQPAASARPGESMAPELGELAVATAPVSAPTVVQTGHPPLPRRRPRARWVLAAAILVAVAAAAIVTVIALRPAPSAPYRCPGSRPCAIKVGLYPDALLITPDGKTLYVANGSSNSVTPVAGRPLSPIKVINQPDALALTPDGATLFVANDNAGTISVIRTDLGIRQGKQITGPPQDQFVAPVSLALASDGKTLWVADSTRITVTKVSVATRHSLRVIHSAAGPLVLSPDGRTLYVANYSGNNVVPVDTTNAATDSPISVGVGPVALALSPDGSTLYVAAMDGTITPIIIAAHAAEAPIRVPATPTAVALSPDGQILYVATWNGHVGTVIPISTANRQLGRPVAVGRDPLALAVAPDGTLYVANSGGDTVTVIPPHG